MRKYEQPERAAQASITIRCAVYGLYSSEDGVIRYIGQTMQRPIERRRVQHLSEAAKGRGVSRCHRWIRKVLREGFTLGLRVLEDDCLWNDGEKRWIALYRARYPHLMTNLSDGGSGYSGKRSLATRLKMSKPKPEWVRAKMRKPKSNATRVKMSLAQLGNRKGVGENNGSAMLTESAVIDIKNRLARGGESLSSIGSRHGVTKATVWKVKTGRSWAHVKSV